MKSLWLVDAILFCVLLFLLLTCPSLFLSPPSCFPSLFSSPDFLHSLSLLLPCTQCAPTSLPLPLQEVCQIPTTFQGWPTSVSTCSSWALKRYNIFVYSLLCTRKRTGHVRSHCDLLNGVYMEVCCHLCQVCYCPSH